MVSVFEGPSSGTSFLEPFPRELIERLALLHGADKQAIELSLQVLPFGFRALLHATGNADQLDDGTWQLTDAGISLLDTCYDAAGDVVTSHLSELDLAIDDL
ncbi:MAG: hypothetical protein GY926_22760 [bacterium]|nr:hypothetical protein [bacterium]